MSKLAGLIVFVFILAGLMLALKLLLERLKPRSAGSGELPYQKRRYLLSQAERVFYDMLCEAVRDDLVIFSKVRIADILLVRGRTDQRLKWQNKINCKHVDFVLCDPRTLGPVIAVELDDSSHLRQDRKERDRFVDQALQSAGLPLHREIAKTRYDSGKIRETLSGYLSTPNTHRPTPATPPGPAR